LWVVLILPAIHMPTPAVYRKFDELNPQVDNERLNPTGAMGWKNLVGLRSEGLLSRLVNDLEPAAFAISPGLQRLRGDAEQLLARAVRMSGSGSSLFTLCDDADQARDLAQLVEARLHTRALGVPLAPR
jgi:4-diphosphocytidyl-2C-methyl-D-erythritol kinase